MTDLEERRAKLAKADVAELSRQVQKGLDRFHSLGRRRVAEAYKIGEALTEAKGRLPHGEFIPWCELHGLNRRTASRFIELASFEMGQVVPFASVAEAIRELKKPDPNGAIDAEIVDKPGDLGKLGTTDRLRLALDTAESGLADQREVIQAQAEKIKELEERDRLADQLKKRADGKSVVSELENLQEGRRQDKARIGELQAEVAELKKENRYLKRELKKQNKLLNPI